MKHVRSTFLAAAALTFIISACSQPEDLQSSMLAPQFGTADTDAGVDVATAPAGGVYVLSRQRGVPATEGFDYYARVLLRRYDSAGNQTWVKEVAFVQGSDRPWDYPSGLNPREVELDNQGRTYVLYGKSGNYSDVAWSSFYTVAVYSESGQLERSFPVGGVVYDFLGGPYTDEVETVPEIAVGQDGSVYVALRHTTDDYGELEFSFDNLIRKYSSTGRLEWERILNVGVPTGIAAASDGTIYVSGVNGLARYNGASTLLWKKSGFYSGVAVSGSSVFAYNKNTVYRFSSAGQQQGSSFMGGLQNAIIQDLSGDGVGGVLVSGKYAAGTGNWNAFARKLNAVGSSQWTSTYGTPSYDDAQGVVAVSTREAYVTGTTFGSLAHANRGGEDGYVRKLGVGGKPIWMR